MTRFTPGRLLTLPQARWLRRLLLLAAVLVPGSVSAQTIETVGSRALGMGGAFVAVANDGTAVWWNPGGLAEGPFLDAGLVRATTAVEQGATAGRESISGFFLGTPPAGFSYYRLRLSQLPTGPGQPSREDEQGGIPLRSLAGTQLGISVVQSLLDGVHAGVTLKYLRGRVGAGLGDASLAGSSLLDAADDLGVGKLQNRFDLDVGVIGVGGPLRFGAVVRNVRAVSFDGDDPSLAPIQLPRQVRLGAAFDGTSEGVPLTVALDVDAKRYESPWGDRRVVAIGAEHWVVKKRLALRGGARFNTVDRKERAGTAGVSVAVRSGLYLDGHVVRGGDADERGWGVAARMSF
jgi:hypothetical protein